MTNHNHQKLPPQRRPFFSVLLDGGALIKKCCRRQITSSKKDQTNRGKIQFLQQQQKIKEIIERYNFTRRILTHRSSLVEPKLLEVTTPGRGDGGGLRCRVLIRRHPIRLSRALHEAGEATHSRITHLPAHLLAPSLPFTGEGHQKLEYLRSKERKEKSGRSLCKQLVIFPKKKKRTVFEAEHEEPNQKREGRRKGKNSILRSFFPWKKQHHRMIKKTLFIFLRLLPINHSAVDRDLRWEDREREES